MLFTSAQFLIFFPITILVYFAIPERVKHLWLLAASYYFYMCWNAKYAILLFSCTFITWVGGLLLERIKSAEVSRQAFYKKAVLVAALASNLGILFYFKYINFMLSLVGRAAAKLSLELQVPSFDIILPVGISFYIFQALGYLIDVYRDDIYAEKNFFRYALFVSFFPQLVAGPIERSRNLLKQLAVTQKLNLANAREGLLIMLWGFFLKMVIADRCAVLVDHVYKSYTNFSGIQLLIANVFFALQIYCDFMGYSTIAKGAAKVLGIDLMNNFSQPYFATSVKDFWRRWHISLSSWLRDYLYIPLGGSRCSRLMKYRNVFLTFFFSGLWHGAALTYVVWGVIHGLYLIAEDVFKPLGEKIIHKFKFNTEAFSWKFFMIVKTFIMVDIAWIFFRADSLKASVHILKSTLYLGNVGILLNDGLYQLGLNTRNMNILLIALVALLISSYMKEKGINVLGWLTQQNILFRYLLYWGAIMLIMLSLDITGKEFIYFQF